MYQIGAIWIGLALNLFVSLNRRLKTFTIVKRNTENKSMSLRTSKVNGFGKDTCICLI